MILVILLWFCFNAGIIPLWLAVLGTVLESIVVLCQITAAVLKLIVKNM